MQNYDLNEIAQQGYNQWVKTQRDAGVKAVILDEQNLLTTLYADLTNTAQEFCRQLAQACITTVERQHTPKAAGAGSSS